jgi:hypothetical protein
MQSLHPGAVISGVDVMALERTGEEIKAWLLADNADSGVVMTPLPQRYAVILGRDARWPWLPTRQRLNPCEHP